jgi:tRNA-splicing ligase RtcB
MVSKQAMKRISDYVWEIPATFRDDMRVPARIYADDELLEEALKEHCVEQLINTATLPGIVEYALAMPDIHQGYGFPIGGVAATRLPHGIISPGGVGYDINCLAGDSLVLGDLGYTCPIADFEADWQAQTLACQSLGSNQPSSTSVVRFMRQPPRASVLRISTASGRTIVATSDHPFWTPDGMRPLGQIKPKDQVAVLGFDGVPYEAPPDEIILTQADVKAMLARLGKGASGNAVAQIMNRLETVGLVPLRYSSPALPHLLRLMGLAWGDGTLTLNKNGKGVLSCYGRVQDLEDLRADIRALGFQPSRVYARTRHHTIQTIYRAYEFENVETWIKVSSTALGALLATLGLPPGNKTRSDWRMPDWIQAAPLWQKRLFLGALFGAEMNAPGTVTDHDYNFEPPTLSLNKREAFVSSGQDWLNDVAGLLAEFGVETLPVSQRAEQTNADGTRSIRLRLAISSTPENLIRFWSRAGFECHREKRALASVAVTYLRLKQRVIVERQAVAEQAAALQATGHSAQEIKAALAGPFTNKRFVARSLWEGRQTSVRVGQAFAPFSQFVEDATAGLGQSGMAWDTVVSIELVADFIGDVYDFTVSHLDHNFIANGFVVSNCGVRLMGTHLTHEEIAPHVNDLATTLYHNCPSGVGEKGSVRVTDAEFDEVCVKGSRWALGRGFARAEDLPRTEEAGCLAGANPDKVSKRARERGRPQVGTLGAGNHFVEVDEVTEIYDEEAARAMGLFQGQVAVQIHCGSRGFGHQVCTDYVDEFQTAIKKYDIKLPDRELVCAPFNSPEGQSYFAAMACAANYAFANRQVLLAHIRRSFEQVLAGKVSDWDVFQVYDIAHNMAKVETHEIGGARVKVCVHRKGATRAFGPGFEGLPPEYRDIGQPVLVPGSMGTASFVLVGTAGSMAQTFGSTCHGAGRVMSRAQAKRQVRGEKLKGELEYQGIAVRAGSMSGLAEEAPAAYKDVDRVVEVVHRAGIARKVARLEPFAVIKG